MAAQFITALLQPAIFVGNKTLTMKHTEEAYIGRVTGIRTLLMTGAMLLAASGAGSLKLLLTLPGVYAAAAACFAAGLGAMVPLLRESRLRRNPVRPSS
ncbi:hypothetical protein J31TS4_14350 [Paenibacillus sp. J31TS4]|uniref:hypothetical protein n=1 Tax=Paenibacillus sp. J31TS4 TaxID=2807195 RepID=UPI001B042C25|nr:hypothetical protein [Paenibacillus sp. J31TS4]GIP38155.1 hypothetical protein J31TS4_14350 [Paenibacillus sp. J31TS4]